MRNQVGGRAGAQRDVSLAPSVEASQCRNMNLRGVGSSKMSGSVFDVAESE